MGLLGIMVVAQRRYSIVALMDRDSRLELSRWKQFVCLVFCSSRHALYAVCMLC
jgi:hypothetical protein